MRKILFKAFEEDGQRTYVYELPEEAELDEDTLDLCEDGALRGIVPMEYVDDADAFYYDVTGYKTLGKTLSGEVDSSDVLEALYGVAGILAEFKGNNIPFAHLILHKDFIFIDRMTMEMKFLCVPLEEAGQPNTLEDVRQFIRVLLSGLTYDVSEDGSYVMKLLTLINTEEQFNISIFINVLQDLMDEYGVPFEELDVSESYVDYEEGISTVDVSILDSLPESVSVAEMEAEALRNEAEATGTEEYDEAGGDVAELEAEEIEAYAQEYAEEFEEYAEETEAEAVEEYEDEAEAEESEEYVEEAEAVEAYEDEAEAEAAEEYEEETETEAVEEYEDEAEAEAAEEYAEEAETEAVEEYAEEAETEAVEEYVEETEVEETETYAEEVEAEAEETEEQPVDDTAAGVRADTVGKNKKGKFSKKSSGAAVTEAEEEIPVSDTEVKSDAEIKRMQQEALRKIAEAEKLDNFPGKKKNLDIDVDGMVEAADDVEESDDGNTEALKPAKKPHKLELAKETVVRPVFDSVFEPIIESIDGPIEGDEMPRAYVTTVPKPAKNPAKSAKAARAKAKNEAKNVQPKDEALQSEEVSAASEQDTLPQSDNSADDLPKVNPYLIRVNNEERIMITKSSFKIGKASFGMDYSITDNGAISRNHCLIFARDGVYYIRDNKSTNHTYVNGEIVKNGQDVMLTNEATIRIADEDFLFKLG